MEENSQPAVIPGKNYTFLAVGIIAVLIILGAGAFFYQKGRSSPVPAVPSSTPTAVATPTSEPTPEPTEKPIAGKLTLKIYFGNKKLNPETDCKQVFAVKRVIPETKAVAKAALGELFAGPTAKEKEEGYASFFSSATKGILKKVTVDQETAYVDLIDIRNLIPNASTSCGSSEFLAEMTTTLKQFATVKKIVFAIDGSPSTFYEWLQLACPPESNDCDPTPFK